MKRYQIAEIIIRAKRPSYEFRQQQRVAHAFASLVAFAIIGFAAIVCSLIKGCQMIKGRAPDPVPAYSLCEQCGEIISDNDHGTCTADVIVFNNAIRQ